MTLGAIKNYLDLSQPRRTEAEALARVPIEQCAEATIRREVVCYGPDGKLTGITRRDLFLAEQEMRDLLDDAGEATENTWATRSTPLSSAGFLDRKPVTITGRLTGRQWARALTICEFTVADTVPDDRRPADLPRLRSRFFLGVDWLRDETLPGAKTNRTVCTLTARAAGKTFIVEIVADDTAPVMA